MCKKHISPVFEVKKKEKIKTFQSGNQQLETPLAQMTKLWYHIPDVGAGFPVGVSVSLAHLTSGDAERQLSSLPALPCPRRWNYGIDFTIRTARPGDCLYVMACRKRHKSVEAGAAEGRQKNSILRRLAS